MLSVLCVAQAIWGEVQFSVGVVYIDAQSSALFVLATAGQRHCNQCKTEVN